MSYSVQPTGYHQFTPDPGYQLPGPPPPAAGQYQPENPKNGSDTGGTQVNQNNEDKGGGNTGNRGNSGNNENPKPERGYINKQQRDYFKQQDILAGSKNLSGKNYQDPAPKPDPNSWITTNDPYTNKPLTIGQAEDANRWAQRNGYQADTKFEVGQPPKFHPLPENPYQPGSDQYLKFQSNTIFDSPQAAYARHVAAGLTKADAEDAREHQRPSGPSETIFVGGPDQQSSVTPPSISTNNITRANAYINNDQQAIEPDIQNVNAAYNNYVPTVQPYTDATYDKRVGPGWGPEYMNKVFPGAKSLSIQTNFDVNAGFGVPGVNVGTEFRRGISLGVPYIKLDANGHLRAFLPVTFRSTAEAGLSLGPPTAPFTGLGMEGSGEVGFDHGVAWGIQAEWPWNPDTQRFEPPFDSKYVDPDPADVKRVEQKFQRGENITADDRRQLEKKEEKTYRTQDIYVFQESYGEVSGGVSAKVDVFDAAKGGPLEFKGGKGGRKIGLGANLTGETTYIYSDSSKYSYSLKNPKALTLVGYQEVFNYAPFTGHFVTLGASDSSYDAYSHTATSSVRLRVKGGLAVSFGPKSPNVRIGMPLVGFNLSYSAKPGIVIDYSPDNVYDTRNQRKESAGEVVYFAPEGQSEPTYVLVGNKMFAYDSKTGKGSPIPKNSGPKLEELASYRVVSPGPDKPLLSIDGWDPVVDGPIREDKRLRKSPRIFS